MAGLVIATSTPARPKFATFRGEAAAMHTLKRDTPRSPLAAAAGLALFAASAGGAQALSCLNPADHLRTAELVVLGEAGAVGFVGEKQVAPWPWSGPKVLVRTHAAEVRTLKVLRGSGAPERFEYAFRDRQIDCDFAKPVRQGERMVFTLQRTDHGRWFVNAFRPEEYEKRAAPTP